MAETSPETQLSSFIAKYTAEVAALTRAALKKMRTLLPGAFALVYDNYNALAVAFGPSDKTSEAIFSVAVYPRWVSLFFVQGAKLRDPHKLLKGSGKAMRHIVLQEAEDLDKPELRALMADAVQIATKPIDASIRGKLIIKSVSAKQRPRRPAK